ncbi:dihydrolipoyl dehydrogenase [Rhizobium halophytocola]|uniref:Dihydrolipoamide dehydrogenase n=1 Tax=Rhizobium halophytocola TaxID=735519 RepID=A0ABS4DVF7_9HYPH|nr:dihydrolipoamide dehydrogenase [Rhizobium halophytocola]
MAERKTEIAIIGAGTAGLAAERSARRAGARTLLIDDRFAGTTCATVGCMPSKLLIAAAKAAQGIREADRFGISAGPVRIDGKAVMQRVRRLRDDFVSSILETFDALPADSKLKGKARFTGGTTLDVDGLAVEARAIVIATGSFAMVPKPYRDLDNLLTNENVFELDDLPASLGVIGAGPLGLELAQAFARLGVKVQVFGEGGKIAGLGDAAVATSLRALLEKEFPVHLDVEITPEKVSGGTRIRWSGKSEGSAVFSHVLVATGRPPKLDGLGLEATGLDLDDHGTPVFDITTLQCGAAPIFIAGDTNAKAPLLHEASAEGAIAGHNAATFPKVTPSKRKTMLAITFTEPSSAMIGKPPEDDTIVGEADYSDQGRARVEGRAGGLVRLYADPKGLLTGASMAAPGTEHMAHLIAWAIESRQTAADLLNLPIYHPTLEEGMRGALRQICKTAALPVPEDRDEGNAAGV